MTGRMTALAIGTAAAMLCAAGEGRAQGLDAVREGNAHLDRGSAAAAVARYRAAVRDAAAAPVAYYNLGVALARLEQFEEAARSFARAAQAASADREKARAHYNRGVVLARAGDLRESLRAFMEALRRDPSSDDARVNLAIVRARIEIESPPTAPPEPDESLQDALQQVPAQSYAFTAGAKRRRPVAASDW